MRQQHSADGGPCGGRCRGLTLGPRYLLLSEEVLDQGAHDLLRGPRRADVGEEGAPVGLLGVADPA